MKVVHFISFIRSGAGVAAYRLHQGLLEAGVDSNVITLSDHYSVKDKVYGIFSKEMKKSLYAFVWEKWNMRRLEKKNAKLFANKIESNEPFSTPEAPYLFSHYALVKEADILHFHQTSEFVDFQDLFSLHKKFVWTLHDIYPFTAGCHYSEGCLRFQGECYPCPQLIGIKEPEMSKTFQKQKRSLIQNCDITIVGPSRWIVESSSSSTIFSGKPHLRVPYGLNTSIFRYREKAAMRELLGLDKDAKILLCIADNLTNKRKGVSLLLDTLEGMSLENAVVCLLGKKLGDNVSFGSLKVIQAGYIQDEQTLSHYLNAADLFVHPALEDNFPNVVLEAITCGLPVIGFNVGGLPDMVEEGINGHLTAPSILELTQAITQALQNGELYNRKTNSENAQDLYGLHVQAHAYNQIYRQLCKN